MSFELVIIFFTFVTFFIAVSDLARFYVTSNSVRTLAGELVRQTLIYCATQPQTAACTLPETGTASVATAKDVVPFLHADDYATVPSASRSARNATTGVMAITAGASYNFSLMLPVWRTTVSTVATNTQITY